MNSLGDYCKLEWRDWIEFSFSFCRALSGQCETFDWGIRESRLVIFSIWMEFQWWVIEISCWVISLILSSKNKIQIRWHSIILLLLDNCKLFTITVLLFNYFYLLTLILLIYFSDYNKKKYRLIWLKWEKIEKRWDVNI